MRFEVPTEGTWNEETLDAFLQLRVPATGGGGGMPTANLTEELAQRHDVTVLTTRALGSPERESVNGVEVIRVAVMGRNQAAAANIFSMAPCLPMGAMSGQSLNVIST